MKKALKLLAVFLCYSIFGLLIGTFLYSLYENILNYVAGNKFILFDFDVIKSSFFYVAACLIFYITSAVAYSRIRYKGGFTQLIVFIIISAFSWGFLFPVILHYGKDSVKSPVQQEKVLSEGYFRSLDNKVYYILDSGDGTGQVSYVQIDKSQEGKVTIETAKNQNELPLIQGAEPYKDILIADTFSTKETLSGLIDYRLLLGKASDAWEKGWSFWFGFISLGFVLCSIYGLSNFFNWKLLNACFVMLITLVTLSFNTLFYTGWMNGFANLGIWKLDIIKSFGNIVDEPVLVIINLFFGLCFIITGIIRFFVYRRHVKKGDNN